MTTFSIKGVDKKIVKYKDLKPGTIFQKYKDRCWWVKNLPGYLPYPFTSTALDDGLPGSHNGEDPIYAVASACEITLA